MSTAEILTLAGQVVVFLTALAAAIQSFRNRGAIQEVHLTVNSRLTEFKANSDQLRESMVAAAHAQGVLQGRLDAKNENKDS